MSKIQRAKGYNVMFCYVKNSKKVVERLTTNRLMSGLWLSMNTMLRMASEKESDFYNKPCVPLESHLRLVGYDTDNVAIITSIMLIEHRPRKKEKGDYSMYWFKNSDQLTGDFLGKYSIGLFSAMFPLTRKCEEIERLNPGKTGYLTLRREVTIGDPINKVLLMVGI